MIGFDLCTSGVRSDRSTNRATPLTLYSKILTNSLGKLLNFLHGIGIEYVVVLIVLDLEWFDQLIDILNLKTFIRDRSHDYIKILNMIKLATLGREPWSSRWGRRLMTKRLWVWIQDEHFSQEFVVKLYYLTGRTKN